MKVLTQFYRKEFFRFLLRNDTNNSTFLEHYMYVFPKESCQRTIFSVFLRLGKIPTFEKFPTFAPPPPPPRAGLVGRITNQSRKRALSMCLPPKSIAPYLNAILSCNLQLKCLWKLQSKSEASQIHHPKNSL